MGLNVFLLFTGFGIGSFLFGEVLRFGMNEALATFMAIQIVAALTAIRLFQSETVMPTKPTGN